MTILKHAIKIDAPRDRVFKALTNLDEMSAWYQGRIEGEMAVGSVIYLTPQPGSKVGWETKELVTSERLAQACVEGPGSSAGKDLVFALSTGEAGSTLVQLTDIGWADDDELAPFCNTHWGGVLQRLKSYVEGKYSGRAAVPV